MRHGISLLFVLVFACGCVSSRKQAEVDNKPLAPGDCITIVFDSTFGQTSRLPPTPQAIDSEGNIFLSLLGKIHLAGLTPAQAAERIKSAYVPKYYPDLYVSLRRCD